MTRPTLDPRLGLAAAALVLLAVSVLVSVPHRAEAAARRGLTVTAPAPADDSDLPIPEPPIPPSEPPAFSAAPMPGNPSESYPAPSVARAGAHFSPDVFAPQSFGVGNGYLAGSTVQAEQERHRPPAGFRLNVPLQ